MKTLNMVYDSYPDTGDLIDKSLTKICRNKKLQIDQLFFVCSGFACCCLF